MTLYDPGNYLAKIEHIWAVLSVDEGGEGVVAAPLVTGATVPLIAADEARLKSIIPLAKQMATMFGKKMRLVKFTSREEVEEFLP